MFLTQHSSFTQCTIYRHGHSVSTLYTVHYIVMAIVLARFYTLHYIYRHGQITRMLPSLATLATSRSKLAHQQARGNVLQEMVPP